MVDLADAIIGLRAQLTRVVDEGADKGFQFELEPIEMTLQAVVTAKAGAGIGWSIVTAEASHTRELTQTLTVRLTPVWKMRDGRKVRDFTIADIQPGGTDAAPHIGPRRD